MNTFFKQLIRTLVLPILVTAIVLYFLTAVSNLNDGKILEDKHQLEEALTRAAVSCYALEGAYPPNLEYLIEHYGIQIDADRFTVKYESIASNLMPDITVLETAP
jgi:hypothetical protein